jgi:hypothetical protein
MICRHHADWFAASKVGQPKMALLLPTRQMVLRLWSTADRLNDSTDERIQVSQMPNQTPKNPALIGQCDHG